MSGEASAAKGEGTGCHRSRSARAEGRDCYRQLKTSASMESICLDTSYQLSLSAQSLKSRNRRGRCCPRCIVFLLDDGQVMDELGRTEVIKDCLNPAWVNLIAISYSPNNFKKLRVIIYDWVCAESDDVAEQTHLGTVDVGMTELIKLKGQLLIHLSDGKGILKVYCEENTHVKEEYFTLQFGCENLEKMDLFSESDPFLIMYRKTPGQTETFIPVYRSDVIMDKRDPIWESFQISSKQLCNGDFDCLLKIECYDWDSDGVHELIGSCRSTLNALLLKNTVYTLSRNGTKNGTKSETGTLHVKQASVTEKNMCLSSKPVNITKRNR
ncbi:unnamed protein product, partial [Meganyctiphanes norvegica]